MARLEQIVARLPEADRVDVEAWADEPTLAATDGFRSGSAPPALPDDIK